MRFNGVDVCQVYRGISVAKETPPGMPTLSVETVSGTDGETLAGVEMKQGKYVVRVNIAGRNKAEAWKARAALARWAMGNRNKLGVIEPSHWNGKCYDGIASDISEPEFTFGFGAVDITFTLPRPVARDVTPSTSSGSGGLSMTVNGDMPCGPTISQTIKTARTGLWWKLDGAKLLTITGALAVGDVVAANLREGSLTINGSHAESRINVMETGWAAEFTPGLHEITSQDGGTMEARWYAEWA